MLSAGQKECYAILSIISIGESKMLRCFLYLNILYIVEHLNLMIFFVVDIGGVWIMGTRCTVELDIT